MKKILFAFAFIFTAMTLSAKKVKFAVDMTGQTISAFGVHVIGDFQEAAGYALNFDPAATLLTQEGASNIYSIVVNIPAFNKYEYLFVNGNQTYEAEFVPDESRVGYNFVDNRWLYVDSLANDTTFVGAIVFGGNAPAGLNLVRFKVDMNNALPVSPNGVHVGDNYNGFSPTKVPLYSFGGGIYEIISYYSANAYSYKYFNGNTAGTGETITGTCSVFGNRGITVTKDTVMAAVCFMSCDACQALSVHENASQISSFKAYPNPAKNNLTLQSTVNEKIAGISIQTISGQVVRTISDINASQYTISDLGLAEGMYLVTISNEQKQEQNLKLIIE